MNDIQKRMLSMFISLRVGVGVLGILFPIVLAGVGRIVGVPFAGSMSAYYHATADCANPICTKEGTATPCPAGCPVEGGGPMRNWFVGNLFFIGAAMFLMKGFSRWEDWALNVAGVMAPCVALIPMAWPCSPGQFTFHFFHYPCAVAFFLCIGFTCVFCSDKTLKEMPQIPNRKEIIARYRHLYRILGVVMVFAPPVGWVLAYYSGHGAFGLETAGIWAFGAYWLVKTRELKLSDVEGRAIRGQLQMNPQTLR